MKELLNTTIGSFGGISLFVILKFAWERLDSYIKAQQKLQREMRKEAFQSESRKKEYVSKVKFDKEFEIYQELSEKNLSMVYAIGELYQFVIYILCINSLPEKDRKVDQEPMYDPEKRRKKADFLHKKACSKLNRADFSNKKYAPFIKKKFMRSTKNCTL